MKTQTLIIALALNTYFLGAQTEKQGTTVHVKKIEKINGVEKVIDTTYTIDGSVTSLEALEAFTGDPSKDQETKKVIVLDGKKDGDKMDPADKKALLMDAQVQEALKAAGVDAKVLNMDMDKVTIINADINEEIKDDKKMTKIVVINTAKIVDATEEDNKLVGKQTGISDNKLSVNEMSFYPNPNTGKFTLDFTLESRGNTLISVLNAEGRSVYSQELKNFSGHYVKEIDISSNPKGVYFVKITQGSHAQLKKLIIE